MDADGQYYEVRAEHGREALGRDRDNSFAFLLGTWRVADQPRVNAVDYQDS